MEIHLIFQSSASSLVLAMLFNRQSFYISWRKDQQKDFFLELILGSTKFWNYKAKLLLARTAKVFDGKFLSSERNQIHGLWRERTFLETRNRL
jgi:hypothetical protein